VTDAIRTALTVGPILTCVGIAWTAMAPSTLSSSAVLIGFATSIWGTHKYGRLGEDVDSAPTGSPDREGGVTDGGKKEQAD
jgi:hypothetical protein